MMLTGHRKQCLDYLGRLALGLSLSTLGRLALPATGQSTAGVTAAETAEHKARMDDSQDLKEDLREAISKKASAAAADAAGKLLAIARLEEQYWRRTHIESASQLAHASVAGLERLKTAVSAAGSAEARDAFSQVESTCRDCHDAHPERTRDQVSSKDYRKTVP